MKLFSVFSLIILILGCQSNKSIELHDDEIVTSHFNVNEISYLQSLLDFVDSEIRELTKNDSLLEEKYQVFLRVLKYQAETDPYGKLAKFDLNRLNLILADIPESFIQEIWLTHSDSSGSEVGLHHSGRFARFIEEAAKSNPFLEEYADALKNSGGISPFMYVSVLMEPEKLDMELARERLILAVHYISVIKEHLINNL